MALCAPAEGLRQIAYQDVSPMHNWTVCFGETKGVHAGDRKTVAECKYMLAGRLLEFGAEVDRCTIVELPPKRKAASVDFAYNEGATRYCKYIAPLFNAGRIVEACNKFLQFVTAGGVTFPGLVKRREAERQLCLDGVA